ncbi:MAG TPA: aminopeptidase, partial [Thermoplasmata archaeon]
MSDYEALAKNVVRRSLHIQSKENVIVECWNHGLDAAKEIVYQLRAVGARPMLLLEDEETHWRSVENLPSTKLGQVSAPEWAALAKADAYVFFPGPADIARYRKNMEKSQAATSYNSDWYRRAERAGLRGARVLLGYVSRERARSYGFEFDAWRDMILRASSVDFNAISRKGKKLAALLSKDAEVEVSAPNGTRFVCELKGRAAQSDDGIVDAQDVKDGEFMTNVPPGYVIVCPGETSAEGIVRFDRPVPYLGLQVTDVAFQFKDGKATWSAGTNEDSIRSQYDRA